MTQDSLKSVYEDTDFIGFYKPAALPTTYGPETNCLVARVKATHPELFTFSGFNEEEGGLLYRLDNETQGLVLFAKTKAAWERFTQDKELEKVYWAEVEKAESLLDGGVINSPLFHKSSKRMGVVAPGKRSTKKTIPALTRYVKEDNAWIRVFIKKGARHQIRIHLASIGHPIVGDSLYGSGHGPLQLFCVGIQSTWLNIETQKNALSVSNRRSASD